MWPFKSRNSFAHEVFNAVSQTAETIRLQIAEARVNGRLTRAEYMAFVFPTVGAAELAKVFLIEEGAPLKQLRKSDNPQLTSWPLGGYFVLLNFLFHSLREIMTNRPDIADQIETAHGELISKYAAITNFQEEMFNSGIASIDRANVKHGGDTMWSWNETITDFLQTLSNHAPTPEPTDLYVMLFHETVAGLAEGFTQTIFRQGDP